LLIFLLLKFWRFTFILLEIISALLIIDYAILFIQHEVKYGSLFVIAVIKSAEIISKSIKVKRQNFNNRKINK
ncbi:hypothetical protein ACI3PF_22180, partial [Lactococcus lactis]